MLALPEDGGALAEKMCINHEDNDDGDSEDEKKMYLAACKVGRECALKATRPQSSYVEKCCKEITEAGECSFGDWGRGEEGADFADRTPEEFEELECRGDRDWELWEGFGCVMSRVG